MDEHRKNKALQLVPNAETDQIARRLLAWLNKCPQRPEWIEIGYEYLADNQMGLSMASVQGAYKTAKYITGGYAAQYQFKLIYRIQPSRTEDRLEADELLNAIGDWACSTSNSLDLGIGRRLISVEVSDRAAFFARYPDGDEDHQILITMKYEVI